MANRLKTMTTGGTTTTYTYDGDGRRVQASTGSAATKNTKFVWDVNRPLVQLVRELDGNNALQREYQYGLDLVSMKTGSATYYYHHDGLGSVTNLTSSAGVTQWTYEYHPYGVSRTTTKNNNQAPTNLVQFAGQYLDPTGLYHLRARQYAPSTGRFLGVDPLACPTGRPYVGTYTYAADNPLRWVDPSGFESQAPAAAKEFSVGECIGGVIIFFGAEFVGTTFLVGGVLLQGFSFTLFGVTFGGAAPVSAVGLVVGTGLELAGAAADVGGVVAIQTMCSDQQP